MGGGVALSVSGHLKGLKGHERRSGSSGRFEGLAFMGVGRVLASHAQMHTVTSVLRRGV